MCIYLHRLGPMSIPGVDVILDSISDGGYYINIVVIVLIVINN